MNRLIVGTAFLLLATAAQAQMQIRTTPAYPVADRAGFSIGPRYSNYATDLDVDITTIESGRQHAIGLVGEYRSGSFVLDFNWDHDPENGLEIIDFLPIDFGRYERDRGEFTIGWAAHPAIDIQGGFRVDTFTIGADFDNFFFNDEFDHSAILFGVGVHTPTRRPFGVYGKLRGFVGTIDFGGSGFGQAQADSAGWRAEGGVEIPIGDSNWTAVPGLEFELLDADPEFTVETNRFFVNFVYNFER